MSHKNERTDNSVKYIIITPVRDEEKYIQRTINSVITQTVKPSEWILVDDGSSDRTGEIIDKYASEYKWIKAIHRKNRGYRKAGGGVIEAFYDGFNSITDHDWHFLIKLDGDLTFDNIYFENCFKEFEKDNKLGIGGGIIYSIINGKERLDKTPIFHVRGATKIYRRKCWEDIGGLIVAPGWDTVDEVKANMYGWVTKSFNKLNVTQLKFTGAAYGSWKDLIKGGKAAYISCYHPVFLIFRSIFIMLRKPYVLGGFALLYGYISSYFNNTIKIEDKKFRKFIREQQIRRLTFRKSIWK